MWKYFIVLYFAPTIVRTDTITEDDTKAFVVNTMTLHRPNDTLPIVHNQTSSIESWRDFNLCKELHGKMGVPGKVRLDSVYVINTVKK